MNFLMLRGEYPRDRKDPTEILYDSLQAETDMYTHLWYRVLTPIDHGTVLYYGHDYHADYAHNFDVRFQKHLRDYRTAHVPDVIFCRGDKEEYRALLKRWPMALRVYYGAGKSYMPSTRDWDLVLVDSERQAHNIKKATKMKVELFLKPAAPHFQRVDAEKKYDVCLVAIHPRDPRKRVAWAHSTMPRGLKALQLGNEDRNAPHSFKVVNAKREAMPAMMSQCRVGILPSSSDDSGPRVVPEFAACGVPVVASDDVNLNPAYCVPQVRLGQFWDTVKKALAGGIPAGDPVSCESAGRVLRSQIDAIWPGRMLWKTN